MLRQPDVDAAAAALYKQSPDLARDYLTDFSVRRGEKVVARWRTLFEQLMVKYLDGNVRDAQGNVTHPDYPESWRRRMAADGQGPDQGARAARKPRPVRFRRTARRRQGRKPRRFRFRPRPWHSRKYAAATGRRCDAASRLLQNNPRAIQIQGCFTDLPSYLCLTFTLNFLHLTL